MNEKQMIQKVIQIAEQEIGYLEKKSNAQLDSKTANAGTSNYTKYWRDIAPGYQGQPWCAAYVSWCFARAFGLTEAKKLLKHWPYVYCPTLGSLFQKYDVPKVGDIVLFSHHGTFTHTGLVTAVQGETFQTIEGNTSGASGVISNGGGVCRKTYNIRKLQGCRFCRPEYGRVETDEKWNAAEEQRDSTEEYKPLSKEPKWIGYVTASSLNVRRWAGTEYPRLSSCPELRKGEQVEVCDTIRSEAGECWYYVRIRKELYGFVCGKYIKR